MTGSFVLGLRRRRRIYDNKQMQAVNAPSMCSFFVMRKGRFMHDMDHLIIKFPDAKGVELRHDKIISSYGIKKGGGERTRFSWQDL